MNTRDRVREMYRQGAKDEQVAEWLFGPQWRMAATPKDGWELSPYGWRPAEPKTPLCTPAVSVAPDPKDRLMLSKIASKVTPRGNYFVSTTDHNGVPVKAIYTSVAGVRTWYDNFIAGDTVYWSLTDKERTKIMIDADVWELDQQLASLSP